MTGPPGPERERAAERLLERAPPPSYREAWQRSLRRLVYDPDAAGRTSLLLVRLGEERFALPTSWVREVHETTRPHVLPGRTNDVFRGLASLRGELHLVGCLHTLLGLGAPAVSLGETARMLVVGDGARRWAVAADEVLDVRAVSPRRIQPPQVTVAKSAVHFTQGVVVLPEGSAALLDPDLVMAGLERSLS